MIIKNIKIQADAYVSCRSNFYTVRDTLNNITYFSFSTGINKLSGEIDSGVWAISYLLSMYNVRPKDFVMSESPKVQVNGTDILWKEILEHSCYLVKNLYPLFSAKQTVENLISKGIKKNKIDASPEDIRDLFQIYPSRFRSPLSGLGNEIFKAMAAIGYVNNKQIFCFPWMSQKLFEYYHGNITYVLDVLESLEKIVILPVGKSDGNWEISNRYY